MEYDVVKATPIGQGVGQLQVVPMVSILPFYQLILTLSLLVRLTLPLDHTQLSIRWQIYRFPMNEIQGDISYKQLRSKD